MARRETYPAFSVAGGKVHRTVDGHTFGDDAFTVEHPTRCGITVQMLNVHTDDDLDHMPESFRCRRCEQR